MRDDPNRLLFQHLRTLAAPALDDAADQERLDSFALDPSEAAFSALVRRDGPMVLNLCRRTLGNQQGAEDAFQATFLVLARKAGALRSRGLVAGWLYGVAHRTSLKVRASRA